MPVHVQEAACAADSQAWRRVACACAPQQQQQQQQQHAGSDLFSLYVHTAPWPEFNGQGKGEAIAGLLGLRREHPSRPSRAVPALRPAQVPPVRFELPVLPAACGCPFGE